MNMMLMIIKLQRFLFFFCRKENIFMGYAKEEIIERWAEWLWATDEVLNSFYNQNGSRK